ncbi:MAG: HD domain-containing protein [Candidatus Paceibacterota bacterium]
MIIAFKLIMNNFMYRNFEILKKYSTSEKVFDVILCHSLKVLAKSIEIVNQKKLYDKVDFDLIISGAILHDIGAFEFLEEKYKGGASANNGVAKPKLKNYIQHGIIGAEILRKEGLLKEALIAERHTGSGFTKKEIVANSWDLPQKDFLPISLEEKIICYADKFSSKNPDKKDTLETIEKEFESYGKEPLRRFLELKKMFE